MVVPPDPPDEDDPGRVLLAARGRFIAGFARKYDAFDAMIDDIEGGRATPSTFSELFENLHRLAGMAGMVGLPTVSQRARELENLTRDAMPDAPDGHAARRGLDALLKAFETDRAAEPPEWLRRA